jgi:hypothetical protein
MQYEGKNQVVIYLEDWQMRMVRDFLGKDCHFWLVPIDSHPVVRYMGPVAAAAGAATRTVKRMYLTEWQKREIADETGQPCPCDFIELERGMNIRYGAPVSQ